MICLMVSKLQDTSTFTFTTTTKKMSSTHNPSSVREPLNTTYGEQTPIQIDLKRNETSKQSKFKPPPQLSVTDSLEFAPFARNVATASMYLLLMLGIVDLSMSQRMNYLGPGIYAICVAIFIYIWHFISDCNTVEKLEEDVDANLDPRGWPKFVCVILTFFANYLIQGIGCACLSVYLCFSPQTLLGAISLNIGAILYFISFIRREKPKPITGIM